MEYRLIALIEEEVEDAHIGQEAVLLLIHLIISLRCEIGVRKRLLRTNRITEVHDIKVLSVLREVLIRHLHVRTNVEELYQLLHDFHVEVEEEIVFLLIERADVVLVILEERTLAVCREEGIPMHVSPVGMVGDTDVLHRHRRVVVGGDGEGERSIRSGDNHTVAIRLLDEALMTLYQALVVAVQLLIPLHRTKIAGRK